MLKTPPRTRRTNPNPNIHHSPALAATKVEENPRGLRERQTRRPSSSERRRAGESFSVRQVGCRLFQPNPVFSLGWRWTFVHPLRPSFPARSYWNGIFYEHGFVREGKSIYMKIFTTRIFINIHRIAYFNNSLYFCSLYNMSHVIINHR